MKQRRRGSVAGRSFAGRSPRRGLGFRPVCRALAATVSAGGLLLASAAACSATTLGERIEAALRDPALRGAKVGVLVERRDDGQVLFEREADTPLIPASNVKIMTALAALSKLGPTYQFETQVLSDGPLSEEGTVGELGVVGGGDPVMNSEDWWRLAADLRRLGLRRVDGDLRVDDAHFDQAYWHPLWKGISSRAYHAPIGALTANYGAFFIAVRPGAQPGDPVSIEVDPPVPYLRVSNRAVTGDARAKRSLSVDRTEPGENGETVKVRGVVRAGDDRDVFPRSVRDPALYAGEVFKLQLEALGISVAGNVVRGGEKLSHVLATHEGRPLSEVVRLFMKYSNNSIAESLVKSLAVAGGHRPGNWKDGLAVLRAELSSLGIFGEGAVLVDGSGLSPENRLSARMLVRAVRRGGDSFAIGPEFASALPIAARDGTLEKRAGRTVDRVRAKTGLLSDQKVTTLSGWAERVSGEVVVFSILVNGHPGRSYGAMQAVDRVVAAIVQ